VFVPDGNSTRVVVWVAWMEQPASLSPPVCPSTASALPLPLMLRVSDVESVAVSHTRRPKKKQAWEPGAQSPRRRRRRTGRPGIAKPSGDHRLVAALLQCRPSAAWHEPLLRWLIWLMEASASSIGSLS
jgi:hypothetical protein